MGAYVLRLCEIGRGMLAEAGGKGVNLGELYHLNGVEVPDGFCVTTAAYRDTVIGSGRLDELLAQLAALTAGERARIGETSARIRSTIERMEPARDLEDRVREALAACDPDGFYAVRSSATVEDLPEASFAGLHDTYLNVKGAEEILRHIVRCWASLFTERAVIYRMRNGFDHRRAAAAVIVQRMATAEAAGVMFTADPMTSDRKTLCIEAGFGLGEALVAGSIDPDVYRVCNDRIAGKRIGRKQTEIRAARDGGTERREVEAGRRSGQALPDGRIVELAALGRKIEAHFGCPQDIEWCYGGGRFWIVQSRPITTLFPIPRAADPKTPRVYMSIGHLQMMTDTIKPLGMSVFEMLARTPLEKAGGRVFSDITHDLSSVVGRKRLLMASGKQDPQIQSALKTLLADRKFLASLPRGKRNIKGGALTMSSLVKAVGIHRKNDPSIIQKTLDGFETEIRELDRRLARLSGEQALAFIRADRDKLWTMAYDPVMMGAIIVSTLAAESLNRKVEKWLGEKNAADTLTKSVAHNITTEMGLALCGLADIVRRHPGVLAYLAAGPGDDFLAGLAHLPEGRETAEAFRVFLDKYGMRCPGEIDITRPRWEERPSQLIPMVLNNVRLLGPGEHEARFQQGRREAAEKEEEIVRRLEEMPGGRGKAKAIRQSVSLLRNFAGCREYPKYYIVRRYQVYKRALMKIAGTLKDLGLIEHVGDIFYLYFEELEAAVRSGWLDRSVIEARKADYARFERLSPPRIITSEGHVPSGGLSADYIPGEALAGIPVSAGVAEGRARVVVSVAEAVLEEGDILVARYTDPSWTPLFVTAKALVTEVGGFTTHGAVIAREYGLPAVVGVENATCLIDNGRRIRVNGREGFVELL